MDTQAALGNMQAIVRRQNVVVAIMDIIIRDILPTVPRDAVEVKWDPLVYLIGDPSCSTYDYPPAQRHHVDFALFDIIIREPPPTAGVVLLLLNQGSHLIILIEP